MNKSKEQDLKELRKCIENLSDCVVKLNNLTITDYKFRTLVDDCMQDTDRLITKINHLRMFMNVEGE